jgi:hypothetical protein
LNRLQLGDGWVRLLQKAGQPQTRGRAWTWCVAGARNKRAADVAELSKTGKVELVGTTARGRAARGGDVGQRGAVPNARRVAPGILVARARGTNWVFATSRGRVKAVAVATTALVSHPKQLRAAVKRVLGARTSQARKVFVPNPAAAAARAALNGNVLAGATDPHLNAAFAYLCGLQMQAAN